MSFSFQFGILETTFSIHTFGEKTKMNFFKYLFASYLIEMTTVKMDSMTLFLTLSLRYYHETKQSISNL